VDLRIDAVRLGSLLVELLVRIAQGHGGRALSLRIAPDDGQSGAMAVIGWEGPVLPLGVLEGWLSEPLDASQPDLTGARILALHGTAAWPEPGRLGRALLRLPLRASIGKAAPERRAAIYDFRLLERAPPRALAQTPLRDLSYVVFDTETTGLLPSAGDEIVQLAALRMLGARPVRGEIYETLVNPRRAIPAGATQVHGVTEAMVAGAPDIAAVGAIFHHFAEGSVLVAHNAPFDMAFLRKHAGAIGKRFENAVLDTVLMSAVIFGAQEVHTLDALTERLGIVIPQEARHTAMGDTIATAAALERMIPMAEARGLESFGDLLAEMRRHSRLLEDLNTVSA
jgi:DNA polymerase-3 subunit epsilon